MQNASVAIKTIELLSKKLTSHFLFLTSNTNLPSYSSPSPTPPVEGGERVVMPPIEGGNIYKPSPLAGEGEGEGYHKFLNTTWYNFIREGLGNVKWPGRLEIVKEDPLILIDGAHNPAAAEALSKAFKKPFLRKYGRIIIVLGIMGDKDVRGIMEPLLPFASEIILTSPEYSRAASPEKLASTAASLGFLNTRIAPTVKDAIELAENISQQSNPPLLPFTKGGMGGIHNSSLILITGSFYTIGEAKEALGVKGILAKLRE
jgi:hypothetical protein